MKTNRLKTAHPVSRSRWAWLALATWPGALLAEIEDPPLEEVVVSGYRVEAVREAELSLSLLDAGRIAQASVSHFEELIPLVPNMNLSGEGSRARYLQLRGVGEREQYEGAPNPSVGFILDDIDLSGIGGVASVFDMQQAEVLRGPQSTRFGGSALAGVVYLQSHAPQAAPSARVELTTGNEGRLAAGVALGGALGEQLSGRLSVFSNRDDGFRDNVFLGRSSNGRQELSARGRLAWTPDEDWDAQLTLLYADNDNGYDAWTVRNDRFTHSDHPGRDEQRTRAGSLRLEGRLADAFSLVSITGLASSDILFSYDGDWGNEAFWSGYGDYLYDYRYLNPRQRDSVTQELRLVSSPGGRLFGDSTDWVVGIYWRQLSEDNRIDSTGVYDDSGEESFCTPCLTDRQVVSRFEMRNLAGFASTETALGNAFSLSLGLRLERWDANYADRWRDINFTGPAGGSSCSAFDCRPDDTLWGGHVALSWRLSAPLQAYARVARGFKAGGFNPSLAALQGVARLGPGLIAYSDETLYNYELGLKGLWWDDRLSADLALFYMDRRRAQLSQSSQQVEFDPNSFVFVTYNGTARLRGLDLAARWQVNGNWALHGALGLLDSEIGDDPATRQVSPDVVGRDLAHAPGYTFNLGASYRGSRGWFAHLDMLASDGFYFDISHDQAAPPSTRLNARLGRSWGGWTLSAWVRNLGNERFFTRGFYFGNEPPAFANTLYTRFGEPRSYGLTLDWRSGNG